MPSAKPRLLIIDQNLKDFEGHNYNMSVTLIETAASMGYSPLLACSSGFARSSLSVAPIVACFDLDWSLKSHSGLRHMTREMFAHLPEWLRIAILASLPLRPKTQRVLPDFLFARRLLEIINSTELDSQDHVLIHSLSEAEFLGLAQIFAVHPVLAPRIHIVLRYDVTFSMRTGFAQLAAFQSNVRFWTDTQQLAAYFKAMGCSQIGVLPIPHGVPAHMGHERRERGPLILSYLGGARGDKGFQQLPRLVTALTEEYLATGLVRLLIQTNHKISREEALMVKTQRALRRFPREWLTLIDTPLDREGFLRLLLSTDLLLLPYDRQTYRRRSSSLLVQANVAGIPTVVPEGSWLKDEATKGAHKAFGENVNFIDATRQALEVYETLAVAARTGTAVARQKHDVRKLLEGLFRSET